MVLVGESLEAIGDGGIVGRGCGGEILDSGWFGIGQEEVDDFVPELTMKFRHCRRASLMQAESDGYERGLTKLLAV